MYARWVEVDVYIYGGWRICVYLLKKSGDPVLRKGGQGGGGGYETAAKCKGVRCVYLLKKSGHPSH